MLERGVLSSTNKYSKQQYSNSYYISPRFPLQKTLKMFPKALKIVNIMVPKYNMISLQLQIQFLGLPCGPVVKNMPANTWDIGLIPHAIWQLTRKATTNEKPPNSN